ncbi:MAG: hypothetical protein R3C68_01930 [Myxococcota bacterium]
MRPYQKSSESWLRDTEVSFREILHAAGHHQTNLRRLGSTFNERGEHILDFLEISPSEIEAALRVCDKLMSGLGPSVQAIRQELDVRSTATRYEN